MKSGEDARLVSHVYWDRKERFALDRDRYPYWSMFAAEEGRFVYSIQDHTGEAGFGDLVICPPNTWFHRRTVSPLSFHFFHFGWEADTESRSAEELGPKGKISVADAERLSSDFRYLKRLAPERDRIAQAHKQHLLNDLLRLSSLERGADANPVQGGIATELQEAHRYMTVHAYAPLNMRSLAHSLKLTPVQLTRRFRAAYGMTPSEFVTELRLARACRLLEETTLSMDKIASRCGYENGFYLSRVFRHKRGMTPSFYRKAHRV
ncbi:helix-turn-helix domain-containing protein [Paenibacillus sp. MWE-103]|uniref:Helix-turn-helix domain-containing protein n=1 Tax=Paenibacillus artemisiicola TaxID=1172618 RepID=A0ABS3W5Y2_9BACL|nr:helix-turn-helix domain-containing protein [Paenibacillus artemisiicola]MBO7743591.1 helix-turn-helix domain-containing protein [Paenibacillus artemisiicola]